MTFQIVHGNKNPSWNTWLYFGGRKSWQDIEITVKDKDLIDGTGLPDRDNGLFAGRSDP